MLSLLVVAAGFPQRLRSAQVLVLFLSLALLAFVFVLGVLLHYFVWVHFALFAAALPVLVANV